VTRGASGDSPCTAAAAERHEQCCIRLPLRRAAAATLTDGTADVSLRAIAPLFLRTQSKWIRIRHRIAVREPIDIEPAGQANGIFLGELIPWAVCR
jgi:hypothetical protein